MNETMAEFICNCLGISPSICELLDKIEEDFHIDEYYNLEESLLIEIIKCSLEPQNRHHAYVANMLILNYYMVIVQHTINAYCDYPDLTKDLFEMDVDGYYSSLSFDGKVVKNQKELDQAIEDWILKNHK